MKKLLLLSVLLSGAAGATPAEEAFKAGKFSEAAIAARAACAKQIDTKQIDTKQIDATQIDRQKVSKAVPEAPAASRQQAADQCALAARATLAVAAYQTAERAKAEQLISTALADANRAQEQVPNHVEATLQAAIALGYWAKLMQSPAIAKDAKKIMDRALTLAPNNGFAVIALAGWHGESVADVGSFLAGTVLGAKKETAIDYYERALKLDPASPTFPVIYAFNLYRLDDKKHAARVAQLLSQAVNLAPRDGFEAMNIRHAREVLAALKTGDAKTAKELIRQYQPFGVLLKK